MGSQRVAHDWVSNIFTYPASKLSPNSSFFPLLPILSLESFHLWVKTSTSSYLFIFIDFLFYRLSLETKKYLDLFAVLAMHNSEERRDFSQTFLILWSMFFSQDDLINSLCYALTLMALAAFHTSWRIWSLHSFNASEHIHSTNNTNN